MFLGCFPLDMKISAYTVLYLLLVPQVPSLDNSGHYHYIVMS
jgi:hypothetical protein